MKQIKNITAIILICLAFSTLSGTIVLVQACEPVSKLAFTAGASQVLQVETVSNQITVQLQNAYNNSVNAASNTTINLVTSASSSGHFYSDKNSQNQISSIIIKQGQNSGSFFYQDAAAGNPTLVASSQSLKSATTQFTIKPADPPPSPSSSPAPSPSSSPSPLPSSSPSPSPSPSAAPDSPSTSPSPTPSPTTSPTTSPDPSPTPSPTQTTTSSSTISANSNQPTSSTYKITVISAHGSPTASAYVKAGASFIVQVSTPDGNTTHRWVCTSYSIDGGKANTGVIYTFTNVQAAHTITFNWQEQYYLNVTSNYGLTSGSGWYTAGSTAQFTVTSKATAGNGTQVAFVAWNGTGAGAYTGPETLSSVIMNNAIKETANWTIASTSLYTVAETALVLFALLLMMTLLLAWRRQRKKKQAKDSSKP